MIGIIGHFSNESMQAIFRYASKLDDRIVCVDPGTALDVCPSLGALFIDSDAWWSNSSDVEAAYFSAHSAGVPVMVVDKSGHEVIPV